MSSNLPEAALPAWRAYLAMDRSKQHHFDYLQGLEKKYERGGARTLAEIARLRSLLREHDEQVSEFRRLVKALESQDPEAYRALLRHITIRNAELGSRTVS